MTKEELKQQIYTIIETDNVAYRIFRECQEETQNMNDPELEHLYGHLIIALYEQYKSISEAFMKVMILPPPSPLWYNKYVVEEGEPQ